MSCREVYLIGSASGSPREKTESVMAESFKPCVDWNAALETGFCWISVSFFFFHSFPSVTHPAAEERKRRREREEMCVGVRRHLLRRAHLRRLFISRRVRGGLKRRRIRWGFKLELTVQSGRVMERKKTSEHQRTLRCLKCCRKCFPNIGPQLGGRLVYRLRG